MADGTVRMCRKRRLTGSLLLAVAAGALAGAASLAATTPRPAATARCHGPAGDDIEGIQGAGRACTPDDPRIWQLRPPRRPAPRPAEVTLEGTWQGRVSEDGRLIDLQVTFQPDGTFIRHMTPGDGPTIRVDGIYTVSKQSETSGYLTFLPSRWHPAERCTATGCLPLDILPSVTRYTMPNGNTLQIEGGALYRSQ